MNRSRRSQCFQMILHRYAAKSQRFYSEGKAIACNGYFYMHVAPIFTRPLRKQ